jgi:prepilin-type processing-associated H-X9-DG protein
MRSSAKFSIFDLVVLSILIALFAGAAVVTADNQDSRANRVRCASNLRQIGQAMLLYANENRGAYPRATYDPDKADKPVVYTRPDAQPTDEEKQHDWKPPFVKSGPGPNDVTAAIFLLIETQDITPDVFICPTALAATTEPADKPDPKTQCNFSDLRQLSYSLCDPYPTDAAVDAGFKFDCNSLKPEFVIAGDINPGVDELLKVNWNSGDDAMKTINSPNHNHEGQNFLFADGHVEFNQHPFVGIDKDNVYTYGKTTETSGGEGIIGSPSSDKDSILLPTAKQPAPARPAN